ncbi:MAG: hypothetical protein HY397_03040 [Candidatus Doudnabacteria bacterium]|nr:hypothetical protein [Candidatus Doudnabacteria bacterium]
MEISNKTKLDAQEKIIEAAETLQAVPRRYFIALAVAVVLAIPIKFILTGVFLGPLSSAYRPPEIIYEQPNPQPLKVVDKKLFVLAPDSYYGYVRIANPNSDLAVRKLKYRVELKASNGESLDSYEAETSLLPDQDKLIFLPPRRLSNAATNLEVALEPERWSKVGLMTSLNFAFEQKKFGINEEGLFFTSAILRNENPYIIPRIEIAVLLYDLSRKVIGANVTTVNDVLAEENRFFRVIWPKGSSYPEIADVEFKPAVDLLNPRSLIPETSPPDDIRF